MILKWLKFTHFESMFPIATNNCKCVLMVCICLENTPVLCSYQLSSWLLLWQVYSQAVLSWDIQMNIFFIAWPWPLILTCKLDLDTLPIDHHSKIQLWMSVRSPKRARRISIHVNIWIVNTWYWFFGQGRQELLPTILCPGSHGGRFAPSTVWKEIWV